MRLRPSSTDTRVPTASVKPPTKTLECTSPARGVSTMPAHPEAIRRPASTPNAYPVTDTSCFSTPRSDEVKSASYHVASAWTSTYTPPLPQAPDTPTPWPDSSTFPPFDTSAEPRR